MQELLHGLPSPIASNLFPVISLEHERTFVVETPDSGVPRDFSTPDRSDEAERTVIEVKAENNEKEDEVKLFR